MTSQSKLSLNSPGFTNRHDCCGLFANMSAEHWYGCWPSTTLAGHNKSLIVIVFDTACLNNIVSFCVCFDPFASHKLSSQVKFRVTSLNSMSCRKLWEWATRLVLESAPTTRVNKYADHPVVSVEGICTVVHPTLSYKKYLNEFHFVSFLPVVQSSLIFDFI